MIYSIIGNSGSGKTTHGKKLQNFLGTDRRNWRRDVFLIDDEEMRINFQNFDYTEKGIRKNVSDTYGIINYLNSCGVDVVVSIMSPYRDQREEFKDIHPEHIQEIFLHNSDDRESDIYKVPVFDHPEVNFIDLDTTKKPVERVFSKLLTNLVKLDKL